MILSRRSWAKDLRSRHEPHRTVTKNLLASRRFSDVVVQDTKSVAWLRMKGSCSAAFNPELRTQNDSALTAQHRGTHSAYLFLAATLTVLHFPESKIAAVNAPPYTQPVSRPIACESNFGSRNGVWP